MRSNGEATCINIYVFMRVDNSNQIMYIATDRQSVYQLDGKGKEICGS